MPQLDKSSVTGADALAEARTPPVDAAIPAPGQIARVRQRLYLVEETVAAARVGDSTLVRLSCVDDDNQGQPLEVLWEREIDAELVTGEAWEAVAKRGFDQPRVFAAYLNTLKWNCVTATNPRLFQSPFRAGIRLDAYQLEPLRKALVLPRVNLFIADDVGLGKTIEAGLINRELLLRKKVREIVVSAPPSMLLQWRDELETRFGLTFEILDKEYVTRVRRERGYGVNPWTTHTRFLISHRLLIDEAYTGPLLDWLEILDPQRFCRGVPVQKKMLQDVMIRRLKEDVREVGYAFPKRDVVQVDMPRDDCGSGPVHPGSTGLGIHRSGPLVRRRPGRVVRAVARGCRAIPGHDGPAVRRLGATADAVPADL